MNIKLRAWDKKRKRMIYVKDTFRSTFSGDYIFTVNDTCNIVCIRLWTDYDENGYLQTDTEVIDDIMPCINIKDIKHKDIYVDDIVKFKYFNDTYTGKIVFNECTAGFEIWYDVTVGAYGEKATYKRNLAQIEDVEVIGNMREVQK